MCYFQSSVNFCLGVGHDEIQRKDQTLAGFICSKAIYVKLCFIWCKGLVVH